MPIDRIHQLRRCGVFRDFSWPADLSEFGRYNLVYGWNGTGKTTLSRLFRSLELRRPPTVGEAVLRIGGTDVGGNEFPSSTFPIRVFNRDFIHESVFPIGGGDVVALCDLGATGADGRVVAQWTYDAYGAPLSADHIHAHPYIHCGHKALFLDRLDAPIVNGSGQDMPRVIPFAHIICHNRNRAYNPALGRFMQADPNATAMVLLEASAYHGRGMGAIVAAFSMEDRYGDGMNLYEYLGSNTWMRSDPLGLSWDPFSMVDDYIAESVGANAAFLERLVGGARVAAYVGAVVVSMLPFPVSAIAADIGASVLEGHMPPELVAARKVLGYVALGVVAVTVAKLGYSAAKAAFLYVQKYGMRAALGVALKYSPIGLAHRAWKFLRKPKAAGACGCFVAGTLVWTSYGMVPIEQVKVGDLVLAKDESTGAIVFRPVEAEIVFRETAVLDLTLLHGDSRTETIRTTDEHPFWVDGQGWTRANALQPGQSVDGISGASTVVSLAFSNQRSTVYNLTIGGDPNYFVGPDGIWVHNCGAGFHHLVARYLSVGTLQSSKTYSRRLTSREHTDLHKYIDDAGAQLGIPRKYEGRKAVEEWIDRVGTANAQDAITQALRTGHAKFDLVHGHSTYPELMTVLRNLGVAP